MTRNLVGSGHRRSVSWTFFFCRERRGRISASQKQRVRLENSSQVCRVFLYRHGKFGCAAKETPRFNVCVNLRTRYRQTKVLGGERDKRAPRSLLLHQIRFRTSGELATSPGPFFFPHCTSSVSTKSASTRLSEITRLFASDLFLARKKKPFGGSNGF